MLRGEIDWIEVEIWKGPVIYKMELNFDLLQAQASHSLHEVAIRKV